MTAHDGWYRCAGICSAALLVLATGCNAQNADGQQPATEGGGPGSAQVGQAEDAESSGAAEQGGDAARVAQGGTGGGAGAALGPVALGTFSAPDAEPGGGLEARLPAEPARTILVADSALFPGATRLEPGIENPYTDQRAIDAGERHFEAFNCSGCHAPLGGGGMGPPLSDDEWIHGGEPAQIFLSIMHGRPEGMPAWASMLPARTVWEIVAYIQSLSEIDDYAAAKGFDLRGPDYAVAATRENRRSDAADPASAR